MLTEDKILEHANFLLEKRTLTPAEYPGWISGATWANGENKEQIGEFAACLKSLKESLETMHKDAKAINKSFKLLPSEKTALEKAGELLKKYEQ